jgi:hypothetical protein
MFNASKCSSSTEAIAYMITYGFSAAVRYCPVSDSQFLPLSSQQLNMSFVYLLQHSGVE